MDDTIWNDRIVRKASTCQITLAEGGGVAVGENHIGIASMAAGDSISTVTREIYMAVDLIALLSQA